jgi:hypothetical protein
MGVLLAIKTVMFGADPGGKAGEAQAGGGVQNPISTEEIGPL